MLLNFSNLYQFRQDLGRAFIWISSPTSLIHVVKLWGVPSSIVSDIDGIFIETNLQAHNFTKKWKQTTDIARAYLNKASKRIKKWVDKKCCPLNFGWEIKSSSSCDQSRFNFEDVKTSACYSCETLETLPSDPDDMQRNVIVQPSIDLNQKEDKDVEEVLVVRVRNGRRPTRRIHEYLVKWKRAEDLEETSWERAKNLEAWTQKIEKFKLL
ncbi:2-C-methyl-D-erythritol 4-phosphate cytidylyltransferase [Cucumis melo var. makuwa]|uniref:2-C-methyl-D-erythritol 4-phosphate cytidylyltransferase n=1 Tax=Cucumis melo var. makuwa TaxID=1194695 RepID=A0A5D3BTA6_CUCMM|nr:2-C-methyl-D-erythritol 4-phosphate cytidylyltransferase [Cucumis melo var. makuwa]TYK01456.1 2-C-methyl-D-erythritol 4-phosphate cytidylyltransferase [Cucumis melo var. makuwa]